MDEPECVFDQFTTKYLHKFQATGWGSPEALACLELVSQLGSTETIGVEHGHSRVHRVVSTQQVHTHVPTMSFVNGQWVCQKASHRRRGFSLVNEEQASGKSTRRVAEREPQPRQRGSGGQAVAAGEPG